MNFLIILNSLLIISGVALEATATITFRYGAYGDDSSWPGDYEECGGKFQSPVAINTKKATRLSMEPIQMIGYENLLPGPVTIENTGSTIQVTPRTLSENETMFMPYITGGRLQGEYEFVNLHFHWGAKDYRGSEHVLDGKQYAMELHIVHFNTKYGDMDEALQHSDGIAVLGFIYEVSHNDGPEIALITEYLKQLRDPNTAVEVEESFSLAELVEGVDKDCFFSYDGSLTTPPCSESVIWHGFPDTLKISRRQINLFRRLRASDGSRLVDNYRALQPLNGRIVYAQSQTC